MLVESCYVPSLFEDLKDERFCEDAQEKINTIDNCIATKDYTKLYDLFVFADTEWITRCEHDEKSVRIYYVNALELEGETFESSSEIEEELSQYGVDLPYEIKGSKGQYKITLLTADNGRIARISFSLEIPVDKYEEEFEELKRLEHHAEDLIDLDSLNQKGISIWGVEVKKDKED